MKACIGALVVVLFGCAREAAPQTTTPRAAPEAQPQRAELIGPVSRAQIEAAYPAWRAAHGEANPDSEASRKLAEVPTGARVVVYLGLWCGDSRREVPRMWKALDTAGDDLPFDVAYVAVDRSKTAPSGIPADLELQFVPTIVVERNGFEVGRIVESAPNGIEHDLLGLLSGEQTGVVGRGAPF